MRDIKFRAWDKEQNKMYFMPNMFIGVGQLGFSNEHYVDIGMLDNEKAEIMQYTGLKDKNGKEIYEGDIVNLDNGTRNPYQVIWDDSFSGWAFGKTAGLNSLFSLYGAGVFEVIGNVHENPELLK